MKSVSAILDDLHREQAKLIAMSICDPGILAQSQVVDTLIAEYYRAGGAGVRV